MRPRVAYCIIKCTPKSRGFLALVLSLCSLSQSADKQYCEFEQVVKIIPCDSVTFGESWADRKLG